MTTTNPTTNESEATVNIGDETLDTNVPDPSKSIISEPDPTTASATPSRTNPRRNAQTTINPALLISIADDAGCQLSERDDNSNIATGTCPFHPTYSSRGARTLEIDLSRGLFHCSLCNIHGDTPVFAGLLWGMAVVEARAWLQDPANAQAQRPLPPNYPAPPTRDDPPRLQNTALLTRALPIMEANLAQPKTIRYLTKLDVLHGEARNHLRLGYCDNHSLMTGLQQSDLNAYEIEQSNLFRGAQKHERFHDRIVIPNLDFIDSVSSYVGIPINTPQQGTQWPQQPPDIIVLPGHRPFLLGAHRVPTGTQRVLFTSDPRLYIVLGCRTPMRAMMQIGRAQPSVTASYLRYIRSREIIILHHNADAGLEISRLLTDYGVSNIAVSPSWANEQLDGNRRDLRPLSEPLENLRGLQPLPSEIRHAPASDAQ